MSDTCLTCGGLIMEPGVPYGYTGKVCHCYVEPKIQRPSENPKHIGIDFNEYLGVDSTALIGEISKLKETLALERLWLKSHHANLELAHERESVLKKRFGESLDEARRVIKFYEDTRSWVGVEIIESDQYDAWETEYCTSNALAGSKRARDWLEKNKER